MKTPIEYIPNFINNPNEIFESLKNDLNWESREGVPRKEYYCNDTLVPYKYGVPEYSREYHPQIWHPQILTIRESLEKNSTLYWMFVF